MPSLSASLICKILTLFLLFCVTKASGGTCLSYGHSCWGGHGKRNGATHLTGTTSQKRSGAWYISRLFNPSIENPNKMAAYFNIPNQDNDEFEKFQKHGFQIYPISDSAENSPRDESRDSDVDSKPAKWGSEVKDSEEEEVVVLSPEVQHVPISKYRLLKIMEHGDDKRRTGN